MRTRLPILIQLAALTLCSPAIAQEAHAPPSAATAVPAAVASPEKKVSWVTAAGAIVLVEGLMAGYSALAAFHPEPVGWFQAITSPLACASGSGENMATLCSIAAVEIAALGLYNALELSSSSYSRSDRFWRNFAGFHALIASVAVADALLGSEEKPASDGSKAVGMGLSPSGAPMLMIAGRF